MISIQILIALTVVIFGYFLILKFNQHCLDKFDHAFFTKAGFYAVTAAVLLFYYGSKLLGSDYQDTALNGLVIASVGLLVAVGLVYTNIRNANMIYGMTGSLLQLVLFGIIAYQSIPFLFLFLVCLLVSGIPQPRTNIIHHY